MMDSSSSISNINTNNNINGFDISSGGDGSTINARRLDKRSKSLASASTIIDGFHSVMTSASRSSSKTSRPNLALLATVANGDQGDLHGNLVKSIQQNFNNNNNKRAPSTSDMKFPYSITNVSTSSEVNKTNRLQKSASILANSYQNKNGKGAPILPASLSSSGGASSQQPTINIVGNPNFDQEQMEPIDNSTTENSNNNPSNATNKTNNSHADTTTTTATKAKPKRNSSSLSSSLRHLITITFNRSSASTSSNTASGSQSSKTARTKRDKKSSIQKDSTTKTSKISKDPDNNVHGVLVAQQNQPRQTMNSPAKEDQAKRSSLLQNIISNKVDEPIPTSTTTTINSSKKQTTFNDKERTSNDTSPIQHQSKSNSDIATDAEGKAYIECPCCVLLVSLASTPRLDNCRHRCCLECMQRYITIEINHSRLNISCPICAEPIHPNTIKSILQNEKYYTKYENFMLRRVLAAEPDARWCPAPDCGYVVLANGCASCPKLVCGREGCNTSFCYHCKQEWHPNQTCNAASIQRNKRVINSYNISDLIEESTQTQSNRKSSKSSQKTTSIRVDDIKECPVCASRIVKMNDGSCNHMKCSICETEFCWLCMKEISDLHYFSPSGCTFWGKKPWSRKKKFLWHLGMLVGAPICIILIAGIAVPAIVIGIPVWAARKLHHRLEKKPFSRYKKNAIITGGVLLSFVVSPIITAFVLALGIPVLLGYVYGVVPLSLCRSSADCLSAAPSEENISHEFQAARHPSSNQSARDGISIDTAMSHKLGDPSIGETSLYMSNISLETNSIGHVTTVERDRESASNAALAGSIISNNADDGNSTRALAGSIISKESGYTLVPAEVHSNAALFAPVTHNQTMADSASQTKCSIRAK